MMERGIGDMLGRIADLERQVERLSTLAIPRQLQARATHNANQSIANTTTTLLGFNTTRSDGYGIHVPASNIMVAVRAGWWRGAVHISFASNPTGARYVQVNHSTDGIIAEDSRLAISGFATYVSVPFSWLMVLGTSVSVSVYQSSGGALNVEALSPHSPEIWFEFVG